MDRFDIFLFYIQLTHLSLRFFQNPNHFIEPVFFLKVVSCDPSPTPHVNFFE